MAHRHPTPASSRTSPTKRNPLRAIVRIRRLLFATVTDRFSHGIDVAGQRRFRHDPPAPDCLEQIVLADYPLAVLHQVDQQVEHLRTDRNQLGPAPQFASIGVERTIAKPDLHGFAPKFSDIWGSSLSRGLKAMRARLDEE